MFLEALAASAGANLVGGLFGSIFGRRRRGGGLSEEQRELYRSQKELMDMQRQLLQQQQQYFMQTEAENRERFLRTLPALLAAGRSALGGLGMTETGEDLGIRNLWFFRQGMREIERQRQNIANRLMRLGLSPEQVGLIADRAQEENYLNLLAQAEGMNAQRLLQGLGVIQSLLGAQMYSPAVASQLLQSATQMLGHSSQMAQTALQNAMQMRLAQEQQQAAMINNFASLVGYLYGQGLNRK